MSEKEIQTWNLAQNNSPKSQNAKYRETVLETEQAMFKLGGAERPPG